MVLHLIVYLDSILHLKMELIKLIKKMCQTNWEDTFSSEIWMESCISCLFYSKYYILSISITSRNPVWANSYSVVFFYLNKLLQTTYIYIYFFLY